MEEEKNENAPKKKKDFTQSVKKFLEKKEKAEKEHAEMIRNRRNKMALITKRKKESELPKRPKTPKKRRCGRKKIWVKKQDSAAVRNRRYGVQKYLIVYEGYDFMQYLYECRMYMEKRHGIKLNVLEMYLKLYPTVSFTRQEYLDKTRGFGVSCGFKPTLERGDIELFAQGKLRSSDIYVLTLRARHLVREFYELLSGEKQFHVGFSKWDLVNGTKEVDFGKDLDKALRALNNLTMKEGFKKLLNTK